jgi:hypothetical protein
MSGAASPMPLAHAFVCYPIGIVDTIGSVRLPRLWVWMLAFTGKSIVIRHPTRPPRIVTAQYSRHTAPRLSPFGIVAMKAMAVAHKLLFLTSI